MATDRGELKIESQNIKTAPGVELSSQQQTLVGSVLDLFAGRPSLAKLGLWKDDAEFTDPLTVAKGRGKYEAQWYGLQAVFSEIERLSHEVKSSGNPIVMDLSTRYVVKGLGKEQKINSVVEIHTEGDKITKVADMWDGKLPDGAISNVSSLWTLGNPFWWFHYAESWAFYAWSFTWNTRAWRVGRACSPFVAFMSVSGGGLCSITQSASCNSILYELLLTASLLPGLPSPQRRIRSKDGQCTQECGRGPPTRQPVRSFASTALTIAPMYVCVMWHCRTRVICIMNDYVRTKVENSSNLFLVLDVTSCSHS